ncbi:MAG: phage protein NinX family protein, partial [Burkholderiales bacterium]
LIHDARRCIMNINELTGAVLDSYVAKEEGLPNAVIEDGKCMVDLNTGGRRVYSPSNDWALAGPLIEREQIALLPPHTRDTPGKWWRAECGHWSAAGATAREAAMRAYVSSKYGIGEQVSLRTTAK